MNLLCTSVACFGFAPPLTGGSLHNGLPAGPGISGELAVLCPTTDSS